MEQGNYEEGSRIGMKLLYLCEHNRNDVRMPDVVFVFTWEPLAEQSDQWNAPVLCTRGYVNPSCEV